MFETSDDDAILLASLRARGYTQDNGVYTKSTGEMSYRSYNQNEEKAISKTITVCKTQSEFVVRVDITLDDCYQSCETFTLKTGKVNDVVEFLDRAVTESFPEEDVDNDYDRDQKMADAWKF